MNDISDYQKLLKIVSRWLKPNMIFNARVDNTHHKLDLKLVNGVYIEKNANKQNSNKQQKNKKTGGLEISNKTIIIV